MTTYLSMMDTYIRFKSRGDFLKSCLSLSPSFFFGQDGFLSKKSFSKYTRNVLKVAVPDIFMFLMT